MASVRTVHTNRGPNITVSGTVATVEVRNISIDVLEYVLFKC